MHGILHNSYQDHYKDFEATRMWVSDSSKSHQIQLLSPMAYAVAALCDEDKFHAVSSGVDVTDETHSNKALLTSSGTSSCGQCPACKLTREVLG